MLVRTKYVLICFGVLISFFLLLKISFKPKPVSFVPHAGTITRALGDQNFIHFQNIQTPVLVSTFIELGETIIVGPKGLVEIAFDDLDPQARKTQLIIYENSSFLITDTFLGSKNKFSAKLLSGWIKVIIQNISSKDSHEIQTENTVIGVRGTTYYVQYLSDSITTHLHVIETNSGKKVVISPKGKKETEVPINTTATVIKDQDPELKPLDISVLPQEPQSEAGPPSSQDTPSSENLRPWEKELTPQMKTCQQVTDAFWALADLYGRESLTFSDRLSKLYDELIKTNTAEEFKLKDREYKILKQKEKYIRNQNACVSEQRLELAPWFTSFGNYDNEYDEKKRQEITERCKYNHNSLLAQRELKEHECSSLCENTLNDCPRILSETSQLSRDIYTAFKEKPINPEPSITHETTPKELQDVCSELSSKLKKDAEKLEEQYRTLEKQVWEYASKPYDPVMRQKLKSGQEALKRLGAQRKCVYEAYGRTANPVDLESIWRVDLKLFEKDKEKTQRCLDYYKEAYPTCYSTCAFTPTDCAEKLKDYPTYLLRLKSLSPLLDKKDILKNKD